MDKVRRKGSGGKGAIPCTYKGRPFPSLLAFEIHYGLSSGYASLYSRTERLFEGFPILRPGQKHERLRTDNEMMDFYSFVNARRDMLPELKLKGMIILFDKEKNAE